MENRGYVILPNEAEALIQDLNVIDLMIVGSPRWLTQHKLIYKLSVQSSLSVRCNGEEFVKDLFLSIGKVTTLIHELLITEMWKEKVFPEILKMDFRPSTTVLLYFVLYHETIVAGLLGSLLFHEEVVECASDVLLDLIDFCHRKMRLLLSDEKEVTESRDQVKEDQDLSELLQKEKMLSFSIGITSISFLSYITRHMKVLPLSAVHRLISIHDTPMAFVDLMLAKPWQRKTSAGDVENFVVDSWVKVEDPQKLSDTEGQIWIALFQMLLNNRCTCKYEITEFRKSQLMRLRQLVTEAAINQVPLLQDLLRSLEELVLYDTPPARPDLIIEQIPEIRERLIRRYEGEWKSIAKKQAMKYFSPMDSDLTSLYNCLSDVYDMEVLEAAASRRSTCANCHKTGGKRCSRCKNEWYCGRKCQVEHWGRHKPVCDLLSKDKKNDAAKNRDNKNDAGKNKDKK